MKNKLQPKIPLYPTNDCLFCFNLIFFWLFDFFFRSVNKAYLLIYFIHLNNDSGNQSPLNFWKTHCIWASSLRKQTYTCLELKSELTKFNILFSPTILEGLPSLRKINPFSLVCIKKAQSLNQIIERHSSISLELIK